MSKSLFSVSFITLSIMFFHQISLSYNYHGLITKGIPWLASHRNQVDEQAYNICKSYPQFILLTNLKLALIF